MLVLSRKLGEEVIIGGNIRIKVLAVQGNQVRLGFTAPEDVSIFRQELTVAAASPSTGEASGKSHETASA